MQVRHILVAQRGNPRFGQDVLQQRIAVRGTVLLHIGEFQQIGIEQPVQFLVQAVAIPGGIRCNHWAVRYAPAFARSAAAPCPSATGTPHTRLTGCLYQSAEGLPVQGERPTEGKCRSMNPGMRARRDVMYASMPWSTACCRVGCSPMSMIVHPEKAREAIGVPSVAQYENNKSFLFEFISIQSSAAREADKPGIMEGTAEVQHPIADAHLPEAAAVFDAAPALDTVMDMVAPQPTLVELLVPMCSSRVSSCHKSG